MALPALFVWEQELGASRCYVRRERFNLDTGEVLEEQLWSLGMGNGVREQRWNLDIFRATGNLVPHE